MNYIIQEKNNEKYIKFIFDNVKLSSEEDVLDIIGKCFENSANGIILYSNAFTENFFDLKTGLAGMMLQKFINYHIKVAVILKTEEKFNDRFKEMILEANKGNHFRIFNNESDAENWI